MSAVCTLNKIGMITDSRGSPILRFFSVYLPLKLTLKVLSENICFNKRNVVIHLRFFANLSGRQFFQTMSWATERLTENTTPDFIFISNSFSTYVINENTYLQQFLSLLKSACSLDIVRSL